MRKHDSSADAPEQGTFLGDIERRYRELVEQVPLVTYIDEPAAAPSIYISPQVEGLLGYTAEEWLADPDLFFKLLHPDDRERVLADHERVFAAGESSWAFEYRLLARERANVNRRGVEGEVELVTRRTRKDGSLVDVHVLVAPVSVEGELVGRYGIYHDISDLQRQRQYFQSLLENSPTAIAAMNLDDVVTAWNPAAEKLFGYTREEAIGRNIDDLVATSAEVRAEAVDLNRHARETGQVHLITRRTRKDGSLVDVEVVVAQVVTGGRIEGFYAIYHDIGELVRARRAA